MQNPEGKIVGARCRDRLSGESHDIYAKVVVNAGGPFVDSVRHLAAPEERRVITPSSGAHITLPAYVAPGQSGMIVPKTKVRPLVASLYRATWRMVVGG